jgi:hypothetical protein
MQADTYRNIDRLYSVRDISPEEEETSELVKHGHTYRFVLLRNPKVDERTYSLLVSREGHIIRLPYISSGGYCKREAELKPHTGHLRFNERDENGNQIAWNISVRHLQAIAFHTYTETE